MSWCKGLKPVDGYEQITRSALVPGGWYVGRGRNANIGLWDGQDFLVLAEISKKIGPGPKDWAKEWGVKREPYSEADNGCFQPFKVVDMGAVSVPMGERNYALAMRFESPPSASAQGLE